MASVTILGSGCTPLNTENNMTSIKWYSADDLLTIAREVWSGLKWTTPKHRGPGGRHIVGRSDDLHCEIWQDVALGRVWMFVALADSDDENGIANDYTNSNHNPSAMIANVREQTIARLERMLAVCKGGAE